MKLNYNGDRLEDTTVTDIAVTEDIFLYKDTSGRAWLSILGDDHHLTPSEADKLSQALSLAVSLGFFNQGED